MEKSGLVSKVNPVTGTLTIACEQAHIWEHTREQQRAISQKGGDSAGRSLVRRRKESAPALISVILSFLLPLSEVKYHWFKSGKGEKTVDQFCLIIYRGFNSQHAGARRSVECVYF